MPPDAAGAVAGPAHEQATDAAPDRETVNNEGKGPFLNGTSFSFIPF
jgi:hypothetical protein